MKLKWKTTPKFKTEEWVARYAWRPIEVSDRSGGLTWIWLEPYWLRRVWSVVDEGKKFGWVVLGRYDYVP